MPDVRGVGDLEVAQNLGFQRGEWVSQRAGWVVALLIGVAALLGVLGGEGPLTRAVVEDDRLRVELLRFERRHAPTKLRIVAAPGSAPQGQLQLWMDRSSVEGVEIDLIEPEPEPVEAEGDRLVFGFRVADPNQPSAVVFPLQHDDWGVKTARLGLVDGPDVEFRQVVYP